MKFSIKDFFSKCDQIRRKLQIWSHSLKKSFTENFIFCAVYSYDEFGMKTRYWQRFFELYPDVILTSEYSYPFRTLFLSKIRPSHNTPIPKYTHHIINTFNLRALTLPVWISDDEKKQNLIFYFHTSLWCLKRFYEGLKGLHKTFWDSTEKCENKNLR